MKILKKANTNKNNFINTFKNIICIIMFLSLCSFSGIVQAREEIPENLIQEKQNDLNSVVLAASNGITLTRTYTTRNRSNNAKLVKYRRCRKIQCVPSKRRRNRKVNCNTNRNKCNTK